MIRLPQDEIEFGLIIINDKIWAGETPSLDGEQETNGAKAQRTLCVCVRASLPLFLARFFSTLFVGLRAFTSHNHQWPVMATPVCVFVYMYKIQNHVQNSIDPIFISLIVYIANIT